MDIFGLRVSSMYFHNFESCCSLHV